MQQKAIIIGAGPAGLTAAYELLTRTNIKPIILEKSSEIGGVSRTTNYKGNRMDMGPHRFFSKSDRVMEWWLRMMPLQEPVSASTKISYHNKERNINGLNTTKPKDDQGMLIIQRLTRIYFLRKFFAYPIQLSLETLRALGLVRTIRILISFLWVRISPRKPEKSLEDFIINKFGKQLYLLFFKDYTEKVWGITPDQISAEWGAQRIKGVSLSKAISGALKSTKEKKKAERDISQKNTETSLIEHFLYPKYGPGSLWEEVAHQIELMGGKIYMHQDVQKIYMHEGKIHSVLTINAQTGQTGAWEGDYFFSTMPVQELIAGMGPEVPQKVRDVAAGLQYRDFINVGVLLKQLSTRKGQKLEIKDNWIYIQERDVKVGRLMIYNNWGTGMTKDPNTIWIGMEYFCNKTDEIWSHSDETIRRFAVRELEQLDLARSEDVLDNTVRRMEKTYPAYFGTYGEFDHIRAFTDNFANLFLIGRNGMHKYNNADHSMLCAMVAVDNIEAGITSKANLWSINTEQEYHEEKTKESQQTSPTKKTPPLPFLIDNLWRNKANRAWWLTGFVIFLLEFIIFKIRYPFANYMPDSYSYLEAAAANVDVNMWPVAYSKFLRLISVFTHSDALVVGLQYFFLQISTLIFLFSLLYHTKASRTVKSILLVFTIFNLAPLYIANYISADALFISLSLLWITNLIWIIYKPQTWMLISQGLLLLACFTVRYNAIYYPIVACFVVFLSRESWGKKLLACTWALILIITSTLYTTYKMQETTGKRQFSAFGGWQLANNALYMYEHLPANKRPSVPARFSRLDSMVRQHMDTLRKVKLSAEDSINSYFYLWNPKGPLVKYLTSDYKKDSATPYFKRWSTEGDLYRDYALFLIENYPAEYAKYFMVPNSVKYAIPPQEFLGTYNMNSDSVGLIAKDWFNYKSRKVQEHGKEAKIKSLTWYPVFSAIVQILLVLGVIGIILLNAISWKDYGLPQLLAFTICFWLINAGFSIIASPTVLRYQIFPIILCFSIATLVLEKITKLAFSKEAAN